MSESLYAQEQGKARNQFDSTDLARHLTLPATTPPCSREQLPQVAAGGLEGSSALQATPRWAGIQRMCAARSRAWLGRKEGSCLLPFHRRHHADHAPISGVTPSTLILNPHSILSATTLLPDSCPKTIVYKFESTKPRYKIICQKPCARKLRASTAQGWRKGSNMLVIVLVLM